MKKLYIIPVLVALFCFLSFGALDAHAEESSVSGYDVHFSYMKSNNQYIQFIYNLVPTSNDVKFALLRTDKGSGNIQYNYYVFKDNTIYVLSTGSDMYNIETNKVFSTSLVLSSFTKTSYIDGSLNHNNVPIDSMESADIYIQASYTGAEVSSVIPIFGSVESLKNFFLNGDDSGQLNKGVVQDKHDFSDDLVDTDIPLAEISNVSHNGFVLNNRDDYNVDLYVESYLYGVKHSSFFPKVTFAVDTSWVFASHSYNFDSFTIDTDSINMNTLFGVDNEGNLASDFIRWSSVYSKPSLLPDYAWYKTSSGSGLYDLHVYDSSLSDSANLSRSEQGCTVYYVRYYHMVDGQKIGGQWMQYTFRDGDGKGTLDNGVLISSGTVVGGGKVNVDSNGDIYITDSVTGSQDLQGNITYTSDSNDLFIDNAFSVIQDMANAIGKVPHLLELLFPFLPWWCVASLGAAIVICIILRIAGR